METSALVVFENINLYRPCNICDGKNLTHLDPILPKIYNLIYIFTYHNASTKPGILVTAEKLRSYIRGDGLFERGLLTFDEKVFKQLR